MSVELKNHQKMYLDWFRHSAPYINAHRNKIFIIYIDGLSLLNDSIKEIIHDIALLHSLGIKLLLVYDAIPQLLTALNDKNQEMVEHSNHLILTRETIEIAVNVLGSVRIKIEAMLSMGLANSPMFGAGINVVSGNFISAKPLGIINGVDSQLSGEVRSVETHILMNLLNQNNIILVSSLGFSKTGEIFYLSASDVASKVAEALKADKLIFLSQMDGLLDNKCNIVREIASCKLDAFMVIEKDKILKNYLYQAKSAISKGVKRVHILPFNYKGAIVQELFTRDGVGTMVTDEDYEQVRMATIEDIGGLIQLLRPLEEQGILVYRSRERLENEIDKFAVIERDGAILACAALYPIPCKEDEILSAEVACVAVDPLYRKSNRGIQILKFLEEKAKHSQIQQLFVLTTRTSHWFIENGFSPATVDDLPSARQELYNYQRSSLVFKRELITQK